jgi:hypothetical protein
VQFMTHRVAPNAPYQACPLKQIDAGVLNIGYAEARPLW